MNKNRVIYLRNRERNWQRKSLGYVQYSQQKKSEPSFIKQIADALGFIFVMGMILSLLWVE